ncbi:hypothetical protein CDL15_Pgr012909 [Punica granatum]|uniref:Uncharacterized protein n=1 Tax=Punica granatum TaxID=22663 RepID=A0A218XF44_PUNGR|nr:hypothetical protein CDL15_Pgr012909 [Punica granatum]
MGLFSKLLAGCFAGNKYSSKRVGSCEEEAGEDNLSHKKVAKQDEKCSKSSPMKRKSSPPIPVPYFPVESRPSFL